MIPYLMSKGENTITVDTDLIITDDSTLLLASLVDYNIKTKKITADLIKGRNTIHLLDREDQNFKVDFRSWGENFNFKSDRIGDYTNTVIRNKKIDNYIINWDNIDKYKLITNYVRNNLYIPVTEKIIKNVCDNRNYFLKEIQVYTNNPDYKNLKAYSIDRYVLEEELKKLEVENEKKSFNWDDIESMEDYIFKFINPVKNRVAETIKPLYNPKEINQGIYEGKFKPFDGQIPLIQGAIEVLKNEKFVYLGAEQGVGKTLMGTKINHNHFKSKKKTNYITLVVAPAITLTQWKQEIKNSISDKVDIVVIKKTEQFIQWTREKKTDRPTYLLIGKETFKLGYTKEPNYKKVTRCIEVTEVDDYWKRNSYAIQSYMKSKRTKNIEVLICPDCGIPLKNTNRTTEDVFFEEKDFKKPNKGNYKCHNCKSILWSACYNKTKKTSVIDYIHRKNILFDSVVIDEAHEGNNSSSIIGNATRTLMRNHAKKIICLSGTSNNGYASSIHNILMSVFPRKLEGDECLDVKDFVKKYGTLQAVTKIDDSRRRYFNSGKSEIKDSEFKEIEGINPIVFTKYLASNCIFATLDDLGKDLPELKENYIPIEPTNNQKWGENRLFNDIKGADSFNAKMYVDSIIKHYINNPFEWKSLIIQAKGTEKIVQPMELENQLLPKEKALVDLIKKEVVEGRKCWIYSEFNNGGDYMTGEKLPNRLQKLLEEEGLKVFHLRPSVSTYERKEVIEKNKDKYDVFISNPRLVQVGLNLVFCPTYIFYMPSYMVNTVSQASRRGYRANSTIENRIYHLYYENTWEDEIIKRYQRKLAESKAIAGQFDVMLEDDKNIRTASQLSSRIVV
ncbi:MAG: SNF2-related protein [Sarcina sp.]